MGFLSLSLSYFPTESVSAAIKLFAHAVHSLIKMARFLAVLFETAHPDRPLDSGCTGQYGSGEIYSTRTASLDEK